MAFNDDEPLAAPEKPEKPTTPIRGKVKQDTICKKKAPLEETNFNALVKITGQNSIIDVHGVDIVTVLDVSGSMGDDEKLEKLKTAMQFFIRKLSPIHRLSVVTFASSANRLCRLRTMTNDAQVDIEKLVKGLAANGGTNITAGLQIALQILKDRTFFEGRVGAIMLMSDGVQNEGGDARNVPVGDVPVHTFGFGNDYDSAVLNDIAKKSKDGTFSFANVDDLSKAFAQCLAGLLTVVVEDLEVTIKPVASNTDGHKPTVKVVLAGNYKQTRNADGSVTISFGNLYAKEIRKLVVEFLFPTVSLPNATKFAVSYKYTTGGKQVPFNPNTVTVERATKVTEQEPEELVLELKRLETTRMMKGAREFADGDKLDDAKLKLVEAQSMLDNVEVEEERHQQTLDMLKAEVRTLKNFMRSPDIYKAIGRAFALASETSHDRQRFASRGDDDNIRLFATPRMDTYLEQAKAFDEDPEQPVPTADEDIKEEIAKDPLGPFAATLGYYLQTAIESLQAIQEILNASS